MRGRPSLLLAATLAASLAALSCSDGSTGPPPPDPGPLRVLANRLPAGSGGVVLEITGEGVGPVTAAVGYQVWQGSATAGRVLVMVKGTLSLGPLVTFTAADRNAPYVVRVLEAALGSAGGYATLAPSEFGLTVER